jgi:hypothetical protein
MSNEYDEFRRNQKRIKLEILNHLYNHATKNNFFINVNDKIQTSYAQLTYDNQEYCVALNSLVFERFINCIDKSFTSDPKRNVICKGSYQITIRGMGAHLYGFRDHEHIYNTLCSFY